MERAAQRLATQRLNEEVDRKIDRCLELIRTKMGEQAYTQDDVQKDLSWGRSYVSQLLNKQKKLRHDQILLILSVIGVPENTFFNELYPGEDLSEGKDRQVLVYAAQLEQQGQELRALKRLNRRLIRIMLRKQLITSHDASKLF